MQEYFGRSNLAATQFIDIVFIFAIAFFLLIQTPKFHSIASILLLVYSSINLVYSFFAKNATYDLYLLSTTLSVLFVLALLIAYALSTIACIFALIFVTNKQFGEKFVSYLAISCLSISFVLLLLAGIIITPNNINDGLTCAFNLVSIFAVFSTVILIIKSPSIELNHQEVSNKKLDSKNKLLDDLYNKGSISEEEYQKKKNELNK